MNEYEKHMVLDGGKYKCDLCLDGGEPRTKSRQLRHIFTRHYKNAIKLFDKPIPLCCRGCVSIGHYHCPVCDKACRKCRVSSCKHGMNGQEDERKEQDEHQQTEQPPVQNKQQQTEQPVQNKQHQQTEEPVLTNTEHQQPVQPEEQDKSEDISSRSLIKCILCPKTSRPLIKKIFKFILIVFIRMLIMVYH